MANRSEFLDFLNQSQPQGLDGVQLPTLPSTPTQSFDPDRLALATQRLGLGQPKGHGAMGSALRVLGLIDMPRSFITSGLQEVVDVFQGEGFSISDLLRQTREHHGFGDVIEDMGIDAGMGGWGNRILGFTGDVILDPLSWMGGLGVYARARGAKGLISDVTPMWTELANAKKLSPVDALRKGALDDMLRAVGTSRTVTAGRNALMKHGAEGSAARDVALKLVDDLGIGTGLRIRAPGTGPVLGRLSRTSSFVTGASRRRASQVPAFIQREIAKELPAGMSLAEVVAKFSSRKVVPGISPRTAEVARLASRQPVEYVFNVGGKPVLSGFFGAVQPALGHGVARVAKNNFAARLGQLFTDEASLNVNALRRSDNPQDVVMSAISRDGHNRGGSFSSHWGGVAEGGRDGFVNNVRAKFGVVDDTVLGRIKQDVNTDIAQDILAGHAVSPAILEDWAIRFSGMAPETVAEIRLMYHAMIADPDFSFVTNPALWGEEGDFVAAAERLTLMESGGYASRQINPEMKRLLSSIHGGEDAENLHPMIQRVFADIEVPVVNSADQARKRAAAGPMHDRVIEGSWMDGKGVWQTADTSTLRIPKKGSATEKRVRVDPKTGESVEYDHVLEYITVTFKRPYPQLPHHKGHAGGRLNVRDLAEEEIRGRAGAANHDMLVHPKGWSFTRQFDDAYFRAGYLEEGQSFWVYGFSESEQMHIRSMSREVRMRAMEMFYADRGILFNSESYRKFVAGFNRLDEVGKTMKRRIAGLTSKEKATRARVLALEGGKGSEAGPGLIAKRRSWVSQNEADIAALEGKLGDVARESTESFAEMVHITDELTAVADKLEVMMRMHGLAPLEGSDDPYRYLKGALPFGEGGQRPVFNAIKELQPILEEVEPLVVRATVLRSAGRQFEGMQDSLRQAFSDLTPGNADVSANVTGIIGRLNKQLEESTAWVLDMLVPQISRMIKALYPEDESIRAFMEVRRSLMAADHPHTVAAVIRGMRSGGGRGISPSRGKAAASLMDKIDEAEIVLSRLKNDPNAILGEFSPSSAVRWVERGYAVVPSEGKKVFPRGRLPKHWKNVSAEKGEEVFKRSEIQSGMFDDHWVSKRRSLFLNKNPHEWYDFGTPQLGAAVEEGGPLPGKELYKRLLAELDDTSTLPSFGKSPDGGAEMFFADDSTILDALFKDKKHLLFDDWESTETQLQRVFEILDQGPLIKADYDRQIVFGTAYPSLGGNKLWEYTGGKLQLKSRLADYLHFKKGEVWPPPSSKRLTYGQTWEQSLADHRVWKLRTPSTTYHDRKFGFWWREGQHAATEPRILPKPSADDYDRLVPVDHYVGLRLDTAKEYLARQVHRRGRDGQIISTGGVDILEGARELFRGSVVQNKGKTRWGQLNPSEAVEAATRRENLRLKEFEMLGKLGFQGVKEDGEIVLLNAATYLEISSVHTAAGRLRIVRQPTGAGEVRGSQGGIVTTASGKPVPATMSSSLKNWASKPSGWSGEWFSPDPPKGLSRSKAIMAVLTDEEQRTIGELANFLDEWASNARKVAKENVRSGKPRHAAHPNKMPDSLMNDAVEDANDELTFSFMPRLLKGSDRDEWVGLTTSEQASSLIDFRSRVLSYPEYSSLSRKNRPTERISGSPKGGPWHFVTLDNPKRIRVEGSQKIVLDFDGFRLNEGDRLTVIGLYLSEVAPKTRITSPSGGVEHLRTPLEGLTNPPRLDPYSAHGISPPWRLNQGNSTFEAAAEHLPNDVYLGLREPTLNINMDTFGKAIKEITELEEVLSDTFLKTVGDELSTTALSGRVKKVLEYWDLNWDDANRMGELGEVRHPALKTLDSKAWDDALIGANHLLPRTGKQQYLQNQYNRMAKAFEKEMGAGNVPDPRDPEFSSWLETWLAGPEFGGAGSLADVVDLGRFLNGGYARTAKAAIRVTRETQDRIVAQLTADSEKFLKRLVAKEATLGRNTAQLSKMEQELVNKSTAINQIAVQRHALELELARVSRQKENLLLDQAKQLGSPPSDKALFNINSFGGTVNLSDLKVEDLQRLFQQGNHMWGMWRVAGDKEFQGSAISSLLAAQRMNDRQAVSEFARGYDRIHNWLKAQMVATPGFVSRNLMGGTYNMWAEGIPLSETFRTAKMVAAAYREGRGDLVAGVRAMAMKNADSVDWQLMDELVGVGAHSGGQAASSVETHGAGLGRLEWVFGTKGGTSRGFRVNASPMSAGFVGYSAIRHANTFAEEILRLGTGIWARNAGDTVEEAIGRIYKLHFNYADLSAFEQKWMKRVFPFYTWTRNNLPLQIQLMAEQPARYNRLFAAKRNLEYGTEEEGVVPDYFLEPFGIRMPFSLQGSQVYSVPDLPFQDLLRFDPTGEGWGATMEHLVSSGSPLLKVPVEYFAGKQVFASIPYTGRLQQVPVAHRSIPGLMQGLSAIGWAEKNAKGEWKMLDSRISVIDNLMPFIGRLRRLIPEEERYSEEKYIQTLVSTLGGISMRVNTPHQQRSVRVRDSIERSLMMQHDLDLMQREV